MSTAADPQHLARELRNAVIAVAGVSRCSSGSAVSVSTQFAGGSIRGIRVSGDVVEVHVVLDALPIGAITQRVHQVAAEVLGRNSDQRPVEVIVADLEIDALPIVRPADALPAV